MINNLEFFLKEANTFLAALAEYGEATDRLYEVDLQQEDLVFAVDDFEGILQEREEIKERAEFARIAMTQAIAEQDDADVQLIKCAFTGGDVSYSLSGAENLATEVIYKLLAMQKDIIEKDDIIMKRLAAKREEIKSMLKNLQDDKKKLNFLNITAAGTQESSGFNV